MKCFRKLHPTGRLLTFCGCMLLAALAAAEPATLRINGLDRVMARNLRAHIGPLERSDVAQAARLQRLVGRGVQDALQPFGYYEAQFAVGVSGDSVSIDVTPGPRVVFVAPSIQVDGEAAQTDEINALIRRAPFAVGKPLSHVAYDGFRDDLLALCLQLGFFEARYRQSELRVDRIRREASVRLVLDSGPRYRFGELRIEGSRVRRDLLQTLASFHPGDEFDNDAVVRFEQHLRDTGYFRNVTVQVERAESPRANIVVLGEDMRASRYDVGAGFSTDSSLRLRFDRITPLLNDKGHSLRLESAFSEPNQSVSGVYRIPHHDPLDDVLEATVGFQNERIEDTDSATGTFGLRHALKVYDDWSLNYGLSAEFERYTVGSETEKNAAYLMPGTSVTHTQLEKGLDPQHGHSYATAVVFSGRTLGSSANFLRWRGSGKWLVGFADGNTTLLARIELGAIWTDAFNELPASLRFYTGGDSSIRGYDFESLGPRDGNDKLIGGRYLGVGSLELSRRIKPQWRIAAFVDGGGAFTERHDNLYQSAGIGVRWLSPIGQVRIDLAFPVSDAGNSNPRLHISMGPPL